MKNFTLIRDTAVALARDLKLRVVPLYAVRGTCRRCMGEIEFDFELNELIHTGARWGRLTKHLANVRARSIDCPEEWVDVRAAGRNGTDATR